jgi:hypothetical protein
MAWRDIEVRFATHGFAPPARSVRLIVLKTVVLVAAREVFFDRGAS